METRCFLHDVLFKFDSMNVFANSFPRACSTIIISRGAWAGLHAPVPLETMLQGTRIHKKAMPGVSWNHIHRWYMEASGSYIFMPANENIQQAPNKVIREEVK
ncbi:hypothetical protein GF325_12350 [Candidatus Bathyarchaeota archaeon]|nr:hypothetical protein [Candidatus Bathyarchaeota archaeon]